MVTETLSSLNKLYNSLLYILLHCLELGHKFCGVFSIRTHLTLFR
jgi:hypothetical protein